ncbi:MAG: CTP synthase [Planctomycetes bacterium]|nr:CTP synthase [Planctomycetota bacterium]
MTKHIFVTGGVVSSLGKGLTSASIGTLLERHGLKIRMQKLDPYLNVDPGTMNPFQHGEVYVTEDGAETDLDLGHYERFTNTVLTRDSNYTSGSIYESVISKERRGEYLGGTGQGIPHITDEIKAAVAKLATDDVDVVITEIGGTVGDIEGEPFLEAIRQFGQDVGRENVLYIHLTLIPYLKAADEIKTKPTQHSVGRLMEKGIQPGILICRTEKPLAREIREKISLFCNVPLEAVIEELDIKTSIYELPLILRREKVDELILRYLGLDAGEPDLSDWENVAQILANPDREVVIAVVGKYIRLQDSYKSIYEALVHGGIANRARVNLKRVESEDVEKEGAEAILGDVDGVLVPGGFGVRGIEGKLQAVGFARERGVPYFGICLGMQCAVIEFARNVLALKKANSLEFDESTPTPVITLMDQQRNVVDMGGTMRLGAYPCILASGSLAAEAYEASEIRERHRHRYEFNNAYREAYSNKGLAFTGLSPDGRLVEIVEIEKHPWFLAVQFHPEFKSKPHAPHPLFASFVKAAVSRREGDK